MLRLLIALLIAVVAATSAPARAAGAREHGWEAIRPAVERALRKHLSRAEVRRLLRKRHVRRALVATLRGYDGGKLDRLRIARQGRTIIVAVEDREMHRVCIDTGPTPETGDKPRCSDEIQTRDRRVVSLDQRLWRKPDKPRPKPPEQPKPPDKLTPEEPRSILFGGYARKEAKQQLAMMGISQDVVSLVSDYWGFRDGLKKRAQHLDPFEPAFEVGDKLDPVKLKNQPLPKPIGSVEGNAMENLRYIYDVARMRPGWPVPDPFGLYARPTHRQARAAPVAVSAPTKACLKSFADTHAPAKPPTLSCFRTALRFRNLDKDTAYQVASTINRFVPLPILKDVMQQRVAHKTYESVSTYLWAHTWMQWARRNPGKLSQALSDLTGNERMQLRWRISKWWSERKYHSFEPTIATIYEKYFARLYPNAADDHGWPDRRRFKSDYLWALNWLAMSERKTAETARKAHRRLGGKSRRILASLLADNAHKKRYPKTRAAMSTARKL